MMNHEIFEQAYQASIEKIKAGDVEPAKEILIRSINAAGPGNADLIVELFEVFHKHILERIQ